MREKVDGNGPAMRLFVAITDSDWFMYLSELRPDELNFRQPSPSNVFPALSPGESLLFNLLNPQISLSYTEVLATSSHVRAWNCAPESEEGKMTTLAVSRLLSRKCADTPIFTS